MISNSEEKVTEIAELTERLAQITLPQNQSLLPNDLQTSSEVLSAIVNVLEANSITNDVRIVIASKDVFTHQQFQPCTQNVIDIFNNVLDDKNREGWRVLQTVSIS